jgi:hypothetical protein
MSPELSILALTQLAARLHAVSPAEFERFYERLRDRVENLEALARLDAAMDAARDEIPERRGNSS